MKKNEYWEQFAPIDANWKYIAAFLYITIGLVGFVFNTIVLIYLNRYKILLNLFYFILNSKLKN